MTVCWSIHSESGANGGVSSVEDTPGLIAEHLELLFGLGHRHVTVRVCEDVADVVDAAFEQGLGCVDWLRGVASDWEHPHQFAAGHMLRWLCERCVR